MDNLFSGFDDTDKSDFHAGLVTKSPIMGGQEAIIIDIDKQLFAENPFREAEDRLLFAKALDRLKAAQYKNHASFTDFMNPQRSVIFLQRFIKTGVAASVYGGYEDAERMMLGFNPPYQDEPLSGRDFPIMPLAVTYNGRFSRQLTHRDFLGATLGLGLDRGKIGDIRLTESGAVMYVAKEVADYIAENLLEVGRTTVTTAVYNEVIEVEATGTQKRITVASLRLDAVISAAFNLSRVKAAALIESEKVFVNWAVSKKTLQLSEGDIVTIRGTGRMRLDAVSGPTKKDRVALMITMF
ncbi:MAG: YlmH/Sll1252 family protein [Defluviitaleaceae bacterium]|nr:YlmH/Sll1252 family protein [Defluviitaleaceae bacterium]